jgi:replicative superfamily II helicase
MEKFDGMKKRPLSSSEIKQIAGRAGRYGSKYSDGIVTCLKSHDQSYLLKSLGQTDRDIKRAGLFPSLSQLQLLSVIVKYNIDEKILQQFWKYFLLQHWRGNTLKNIVKYVTHPIGLDNSNSDNNNNSSSSSDSTSSSRSRSSSISELKVGYI